VITLRGFHWKLYNCLTSKYAFLRPWTNYLPVSLAVFVVIEKRITFDKWNSSIALFSDTLLFASHFIIHNWKYWFYSGLFFSLRSLLYLNGSMVATHLLFIYVVQLTDDRFWWLMNAPITAVNKLKPYSLSLEAIIGSTFDFWHFLVWSIGIFQE
jgi:hypothetical protein